MGASRALPLQNWHRLPEGTCPSEVVRDQTRDKLGKDEEEIPQPLYLFVSLIAIFAYVVVYKVLHNIWSYWLGSLGEIFKGTGAAMHPSPVVSQGPVPVCTFTPSLASALLVSILKSWCRGAVSSPALLLACVCHAGFVSGAGSGACLGAPLQDGE